MTVPGTLAATVAEGSDVTEGAKSDAAAVGDNDGSISAKLRGLVKWAFERMPNSLGQKIMAESLSVTLASDLGSTTAPATTDRGIVTRPIPTASPAVAAAWTHATALDTAIVVACGGYDCCVLQFNGAGYSVGQIAIEATVDGTTWVAVSGNVMNDPGNRIILIDLSIYSGDIFVLPSGGFAQVRARLASAIDAGSLSLTLQAMDSVAPVFLTNVTQYDRTALQATVWGPYAHDAGIGSGAANPFLIAGRAHSAADSAPGNKVSATGDATRVSTDRDGVVHVRPHGARIWDAEFDGAAQQTNATLKAAAGSGLSLLVTAIVCSVAGAVDVSLLDGSGGAVKWKGRFAAATAPVAITLNTPIKLTANTLLALTTSAAVGVSLTVTGYTAE